MEEEIIKNLKSTYNPSAIILHGSRARGMERQNSDWDIVLLFSDETTVKSGRSLIEGQNVEFSVHQLPIPDIYKTFEAKLQKALVLYEKNSEGSDLLTQAKAYYDEGVYWSPEKLESHKLWFEGRVEGMRHYTNEPELFYKYFSDLYSRLTNYWYWIKQNKHSEPIYVALGEIEDQDREYSNLLKKFTSPDTNLKYKVEVAKLIHDHLFI